MAIEIVDFPINSMVDLSIVMLVFTRGFSPCFDHGNSFRTSKELLPSPRGPNLCLAGTQWITHDERKSNEQKHYKYLLYKYLLYKYL